MFYPYQSHLLRSCSRLMRVLPGACILLGTSGLAAVDLPAVNLAAAVVSGVDPGGRSADPHRVPCGWIAAPDPGHPEWPRHILRVSAAEAEACPAPIDRPNGSSARKLAVHAAAVLSMVSATRTSSTVLRVIALEDGAVDGIIRCRSSFDGGIFLGRVLDPKTVELIRRERSNPW